MRIDTTEAVRDTTFLHPFVAKARQEYYCINAVIVIVSVFLHEECDYKYGVFIM
jgi:hypothetical protein